MSTTMNCRRSANEKSVDELQADTLRWDSLLQIDTEEIHFLKQFLTSDIYQDSIPNLFERLQEFYDEVEERKAEKIELHEELHNHKNDLNGMMECEDISCESFYHSQHQKLSIRLEKHIEKMQDLKLRILRFTTPLLKRNSN
ncbi:hypothetical protein LZ575_00720 [Antarcticibacterium sp. 1MA-6-2]|uniref:hypothetical protein n=1 Tax=Antarcticibacterium sp. 1MA-6-2 TaxID=2908210 RepID=UPI001F1E6193|nr:hypothetical protein [Antarcticibacterium sp. 1MA-6-2]UJH91354.1 hypothetical protein LZ575_00720 [Antarcticibacterium sp. 1MA-6-2]